MRLHRIFIFLALTIFAMSAMAAPDDKSWQVAVARNKAGDIRKVVRYRAEIPSWLKRSAYPALVVISWPTAKPKGMPTNDESSLHYAFEDRLQAAEENERVGFLSGVATGEGKVEWFYYAKSHEGFMSILNGALRGQQRLPIAISLEKDAEWSMHKILSGGK